MIMLMIMIMIMMIRLYDSYHAVDECETKLYTRGCNCQGDIKYNVGTFLS